MENNNQISFYEKFEFGDYMSLDEQIQRSMQAPFETNDLTNNSLIEYPPSFSAQENFNNNDIISQTFENNNISCETDLLPWSECSLLYEECFSTPLPQICSTTITTTSNSNVVDLDPIPNFPTFFDQNELNDPNIFSSFLNDPDNHIDYNMISTQPQTAKANGKQHRNSPKIDSIHYEDIRKYFGKPIDEAAKTLNVSRSSLRRRCRELKIKRWPYRKIRSLETLVSNVKKRGMMEVAQKLEEDKEKLHYLPGLELTEETIRLRQVCFKANHEEMKASLTIRTRRLFPDTSSEYNPLSTAPSTVHSTPPSTAPSTDIGSYNYPHRVCAPMEVNWHSEYYSQFPYQDYIPGVIEDSVIRWFDPLADGHCGFRVLSHALRGSENDFGMLRIILLEEICDYRYAVAYSDREYNSTNYSRINCDITTGCGERNWMTTCDLHAFATKFNWLIVVVTAQYYHDRWSWAGSCTYAPLRWRDGISSVFGELWIVHAGAHFVRIGVQDNCPMPPMNNLWLQTRDASVANLLTESHQHRFAAWRAAFPVEFNPDVIDLG